MIIDFNSAGWINQHIAANIQIAEKASPLLYKFYLATGKHAGDETDTTEDCSENCESSDNAEEVAEAIFQTASDPGAGFGGDR